MSSRPSFGDALGAEPLLGAALGPASAPSIVSGAPAMPAPAARRRIDPRWIGIAVAGTAVLVGALWWTLRPALAITGVQGPKAHLIANGRPQAIQLEFEARNSQPKSVAVRFVGGDQPYTPSTWTVPVDATGRSSGPIAAGTLAPRAAAAPGKATFEYTLVDRDGRRSEPFTQTFDVLPPVTITQARVQGPVRPGRPVSVQLGYRKGAGEIVEIQQRVVDSTAPWAQPQQAFAVNLAQASGSYDLLLEAPSQPMRSTVEFTLVDSLGVSSDPVQVSINATGQPITSGPATVIALSQVATGASSGGGAVAGAAIGYGVAQGFGIGQGRGRQVARAAGIVGGAYLGNEAEKHLRGTWSTTVRFDDGNTRRIETGRPSWSVGDRVMVSGNTINR